MTKIALEVRFFKSQKAEVHCLIASNLSFNSLKDFLSKDIEAKKKMSKCEFEVIKVFLVLYK